MPRAPEAARFRRLPRPRSPAFGEQVLGRLRSSSASHTALKAPAHLPGPPRCAGRILKLLGEMGGVGRPRAGMQPRLCFRCRRHDRPVPLLHPLLLGHHCRLLPGPDATLHPGLLLSAGERP